MMVQPRDSILQVALSAVQRLLLPDAPPESLYQTLGELGNLLQVSRAYIFETFSDPKTDQQHVGLRYEWLAENVVSLKAMNPDIGAIPVESFGRLAEWSDRLKAGDVFYSTTRDLRLDEQSNFEASTLSVLIVPILVNHEWWGILGFDDCVIEREWTEIEIDALKIAASILGATLFNKQTVQALRTSETNYRALSAQLERRAEAMAALYETSLDINSQPDLSTLFYAIVKRAAKLIDAQIGGLYLMRPDNRSLELVVSYNLPKDYTGVVLQLGEGLSGKIAQTGQPMLSDDYSIWAGRAAVYDGTPFRRVIGVPLKVGGKVIGTITLSDIERTGPYDDEEVRLVSLFADQAAIALTNVRLFEKVHEELAERKKAEDALQISEMRFRTLTENSPDYIHIIDLSTNETIYINRPDVLGYSAVEILKGRDTTLIIHPDDLLVLQQHWRQALASQLDDQAYVEYRLRRKDGDWEWLQSRFTVMSYLDGKPHEMLATTTLVTDRKRDEEALAQSLNFYLGLLDTFPVPIWRSEIDSHIHFLNTSWFAFTGLTLNHTTQVAWRASFHPDDWDKWEKIYTSAFKARRSFEVECRIYHTDGTFHTVMIVGQPFNGLDGHFVGYLGVIFDITEIREAQQRILELNLEKARVKMLEDFIGDVSHDLRTPLSTIILNTYLLRSASDEPKRQERLTILEAQAERLKKTVQDLLDISRLEINITELTFTQVDVNQMVMSIAQFYAPHIAQKKLQLEIDANKPLPSILANETQFHRGVANLVENAMKYTKKGGISIKTYRRDELIIVEIADTGIGIPAEHLARIFDRFYKADRARSTEGAGLGLAISKKIIEAHGGKIEVESIEGVGTTFFVILPVYPANL